jgi:hypothetical protein
MQPGALGRLRIDSWHVTERRVRFAAGGQAHQQRAAPVGHQFGFGDAGGERMLRVHGERLAVPP